METAYRLQDAMLGVLLGLAGEDVTVMLISDHGFHPDRLRPRHIPTEPAGIAVQHRTHGIFVLSGPGIRRDEQIFGASILDVTPTLLTLYGLPVGEDMDGKALLNVFACPPPLRSIPSWDAVPGEDGSHPPEFRQDPVAAAEEVRQLADLGYIETPDADGARAAADADTELRFHLARSYMHAERCLDALEILESLRASRPEDDRFGVQTVLCLQTLGHAPAARQVLEETLITRERTAQAASGELAEFKKTLPARPEDWSAAQKQQVRRLIARASINPVTVWMLQGRQALAEDNPSRALHCFEQVLGQQPEHLQALLRKGETLLIQKNGSAAEDAFRRVLALDPHQASAHVGLARSFLSRRRDFEAADSLLTGIGLIYHNPQAHFWLGVALHRLGQILPAIEALTVCLAQNPNFADAHERLAHLYRKRLGNESQARHHDTLALEARARVRDLLQSAGPSGALRAGRAAFTPETGSLPSAPPLDTPLSEITVIVSGLPRSGTSMMMRMLARGGLPLLCDQDRAADAGNPHGYFEYGPVKRIAKDTSWLAEAKGRAVKIVSPLLLHLPRSPDLACRVILMERDAGEVAASQQALITLRKGADAAAGTRPNPDTLAKRADTFRRLLALWQIPALSVSHADCLASPDQIADTVNRFLGGVLDPAAMARAIDPALHRQKTNTRP